MMLIADSGASKTDWRVVNGSVIGQAKTPGLNPYQLSFAEITDILEKELKPEVAGVVESIFFYGAGCLVPDKKNKIRSALHMAFPEASINVDTDMVGACFAVSGNEASIVCILGTGANSCVFDGQKITTTQPSLGFMLGDEGSGSYLGRKLIQHYYRGIMPLNMRDDFQKMFDLDPDVVLDRIYRRPMAAKYLANFTRVMIDHKDHPYVYDLVLTAFQQFFDHYVLKYPEHAMLPVHFVGSFAYYYNSILRVAAREKNVTLGRIIESPIAGLTLHHQKNP